MRKALWFLIRVIGTAGWLSLSVVATARAQYRVVTQPWQDTVLTTGLDTARAERAFCASVVVSRESLTVTVDQVIEALHQRSFAANDGGDSEGVAFACPRGAALIHWHLGSAGHHHGPSTPDLHALEHLPFLPPAAFIVYRATNGAVEYIAYGVTR